MIGMGVCGLVLGVVALGTHGQGDPRVLRHTLWGMIGTAASAVLLVGWLVWSCWSRGRRAAALGTLVGADAIALLDDGGCVALRSADAPYVPRRILLTTGPPITLWDLDRVGVVRDPGSRRRLPCYLPAEEG